MKRSRAIRLVLLGGGVAAMVAACSDGPEARRRACEDARARNSPEAERLCRLVGTTSPAAWTQGRTPQPPPEGLAGPGRRGGFGMGALLRGGG